jgi:RNA polymerase sigma factor (sigma-70 family)
MSAATGFTLGSSSAAGYHQPPEPGTMPQVGSPTGGGSPLESTMDLIARAKQGDDHAVGLLYERSMPALRRWARGRLPTYARDMADTQDIVQDAILRTLRHGLRSFEARRPGALQAYLRQAVVNRIRDEIRRLGRTPLRTPLSDTERDGAPSPLDLAMTEQGLERYDAALQRLKAIDREAIIARIELQQSYEEVAVALGKPNANAARLTVVRALARLIDKMNQDR